MGARLAMSLLDPLDTFHARLAHTRGVVPYHFCLSIGTLACNVGEGTDQTEEMPLPCAEMRIHYTCALAGYASFAPSSIYPSRCALRGGGHLVGARPLTLVPCYFLGASVVAAGPVATPWVIT